MEDARPQDVAYTYLLKCWYQHRLEQELEKQKRKEDDQNGGQ